MLTRSKRANPVRTLNVVTRFVWTADVLPNEIAPYMDAQMDHGVLAMQKALGRKAA